MYFSFRKQPEPEKPIYKKRPIATIAVILSMIGMFVLGPVGAIYKGMTEELKKKADYDTLILIMKQQKEKDDRQWEEINRQRQTTSRSAPIPAQQKVALTPQEFNNYMNMDVARRAKYKQYLQSIGKDVSGLP